MEPEKEFQDREDKRMFVNSQDPSRVALGTLTISDAAGTFSIVCTGVTLQKVPDRVFDRTATNLVYTLLATTITEQ